nr:menaquinone biosynthesis protein [Desulfobulbaceae bacterium]
MVNFINTAPLYEVWKETVRRPDWLVVEDTPSRLNAMLYGEQLDLGFISSHEYAVHPDLYRILADLSISATGKVGSVNLYSAMPIHELSGERVMLSRQSQTSNALLQIILDEFYGVKPLFVADEGHNESAGGVSAVLAIGDQALRLKDQGSYKHVLDLGEVWFRQTGLPFVFAVWAVREDFCKDNMDTVMDVHCELLRCIDEGKNQLEAISAKVAPRIPMGQQECFKYLQKIEHDLNDEKKKGLELFFQYLINRDEGKTNSLPLKLCGLTNADA